MTVASDLDEEYFRLNPIFQEEDTETDNESTDKEEKKHFFICWLNTISA